MNKKPHNRFYKKINEAAFDTYDPDAFDNNAVQMDGYDPDYLDAQASAAATAQETARPGQKMQLNLTLNNPTASKITFELFSAMDSLVTRQKPELIVGAYTMIPLNSFEGIAAGNVGTAGFDKDGNLVMKGAALAPVATVGCGEYPYISLFNSTKVLPFKVNFMRYTCTTDQQLNNGITHFQRTFAGGEKSNNINVRAYFNPNQFQNRIVDLKAPYTIDGEKGLRVPVNAGETVQLALFISRWTRNTI